MAQDKQRYAYWARELDLQSKGFNPQERHNYDAEAKGADGYWRILGAKTKPDYPVMIWTADDGTVVFQIGRMQPLNSRQNETEWFEFLTGSFLKTEAVSEEEYHRALERGVWNDGKPSRKQTEDVPAGGNNPPSDESIADELSVLTDRLERARKPSSVEEANRLQGLLDQMRALLNRAEKARETEKAPHLEAGRAVDAKWKGIATPGADAYRAATALQKQFLAEEEKRREEAARKERERLAKERREAEEAALAAAAEAEAKAKAAAEAAAKANADDAAAKAAAQAAAEEAAKAAAEAEEKLAEAAEAPVEVQAAPVRAGTAFGRAAGLKTVTEGRLVDIRVFVAHLLDTGDAALAEFVDKRVLQFGRAKVAVPGMKLEEVRK
jgi:chemotaxis protein histidine kinase CheA